MLEKKLDHLGAATIVRGVLTGAFLAMAMAAQAYQLGERLLKDGPAASSAAQGKEGGNGYQHFTWDALVPKSAEADSPLKGLDLAALQDNDPKAQAALKQAKDQWKQAPADPLLNGKKIKMLGFLIPLDPQGEHNKFKEFLLVPYFGACIHSPPPPANQILHVKLQKPVQGFEMMAPVWVAGTLAVDKADTAFGTAAYSLRADSLTHYR